MTATFKPGDKVRITIDAEVCFDDGTYLDYKVPVPGRDFEGDVPLKSKVVTVERNSFAPHTSEPIGFQQLMTSLERVAEAHDQYRAGELSVEEFADAVHEQVGDKPVRLGDAS